MSSSKTVIKAIINSFKARVVKALSRFAVQAQSAPEKFRKEFDLFQSEIVAEAERLEKESDDDLGNMNAYSPSSGNSELQLKIDRVRAKIRNLSKDIEGLA